MADTKLLDECDVVVPVTQIAPFLVFVKSLEETVGLTVKSFGHAGDGHANELSLVNAMDYGIRMANARNM